MHNANLEKESKSEKLKRIWDNNKGKLAVVTTATTVGLVLLMRRNNDIYNKFIDEHGLKEEFFKYLGADEEELAELLND